MLAFSRPATHSDGVSAHEFDSMSHVCHAGEKRIARGLLHADPPCGNPALRNPLCCEHVGTFILLPNPDFRWPSKLLAQTPLFKSGANQDWVAPTRNQQGEKPFTRPPLDARKIRQRCTWRNVKPVEGRFCFCHQYLSASDASMKLLRTNWLRA